MDHLKLFEDFNKITINGFLKISETNKPNWTEFDINSIKSEFGFIEKLWSELYKEYESKPQSILQFVLGQINNLKRKNINGIDTVEIFRAITLPLGDIKKGLGKYWTSDEEFAIVYHSYDYDEKDVYVLKGYCSLNDIDWHFTLGADYKSGDIPMPIEEWGTSWGEVEVRLIEGSTVYVDGYKNNNKWIDINGFYYVV